MAASSCDPLSKDLASSVNRVLQEVSAFINPRLRPGERLCVALSGGLDSVVLLDACERLRTAGLPVQLSALHVHHGLSAHADDWATFCAQRCAASNIPLQIVHVNVPPASREGPEGAARRLRYAAFATCLAEWLALAHHQDDQAETVLFRLLRGAGVQGASAMPEERSLNGRLRLVRPLLHLPRQALADYARTCSLSWVEDESNGACGYRRNFLRWAVMPRVRERFPGGVEALARAARHFSEAANLLDELAAADRESVLNGDGFLDIHRLRQLNPARMRNLLRYEWAAQGFRAPDARWLDEALRQLAAADAGAAVCVSTPEGELRAYRGQLRLLRRRAPVPLVEVRWCGETSLPWASGTVRFLPSPGVGIGKGLLLGGPVILRRRRGGEQLQPDPGRPRKPLRKLLQEAGLPPWEREQLPLLWCGPRLVWVSGLGVDTRFACRPDEEGIMVSWDRPSPSAECGASFARKD